MFEVLFCIDEKERRVYIALREDFEEGISSEVIPEAVFRAMDSLGFHEETFTNWAPWDKNLSPEEIRRKLNDLCPKCHPDVKLIESEDLRLRVLGDD